MVGKSRCVSEIIGVTNCHPWIMALIKMMSPYMQVKLLHRAKYLQYSRVRWELVFWTLRWKNHRWYIQQFSLYITAQNEL